MLMMRNLLHFPLPGVRPQLAQRLEHQRTEILRQWRQLTPQVIPLANLARRYRVQEHTLSRVIKAWVGALHYLEMTRARARAHDLAAPPRCLALRTWVDFSPEEQAALAVKVNTWTRPEARRQRQVLVTLEKMLEA
jgi:hypothetical protein